MQPEDHPRIIRRGPFIIHHYSRIGSTNDVLKSTADGQEFLCAVADEQTAGRGRRSRSWHSAPGEGLYLSVLLRPPAGTGNVTLLSLLAAVAVAETLTGMGLPGIDIKWPNDVLCRERKISGVLVEGAGSGEGTQRFIIGIGINVNHREFPDELTAIATSFAIESGTVVPVDGIRDRLLDLLHRWYLRWLAGESSAILDRWRELSSYAAGKRVTVTLESEKITGETVGLMESGALIVRTDAGELRTVIAGEVSALRESSYSSDLS